MKRVILVDDHKVVRDGVKLLLDTQENFTVIGEGNSGLEVKHLLETGIVPDIVMTDMQMAGMDGFELLQFIKKEFPSIQVVFLSMVEKVGDIKRILDAGASGYLLKNAGYEEILFALHKVGNGGRYICSEIGFRLLEMINTVIDDSTIDLKLAELDISIREREVLQLLVDGYTTSEISDKLFISKRTVEGHRQKLLEKTNSKNYAELIKFSILNSLVV